jgi:hypothetical protein
MMDEKTFWEKGKAELDKRIKQGPRGMCIFGYKRDPKTGKYRDEDLGKMLKEATDWSAGAFGANGTCVPTILSGKLPS